MEPIYLPYQYLLFFAWKILDWEKRGGNTEGAPKKDFGAIPFFLVIADYKKAFLM